MLSRKTLGIAGAAIVGTLVGTNAAHAVIENTGGTVSGAATYAIEGLVSGTGRTVSSTDTTDKATYYVVEDSDDTTLSESTLNVNLNPGDTFIPSADAATVTYELTNMVFAGTTPPALCVDAGNDGDCDSGGGTAVVTAGGGNGDNMVAFSISSATMAAADTLLLDISALGVRTDAAGSIKMTALYVLSTIANRVVTQTVKDAVKTATALKETVEASDATALVTEDFKKFTGEKLKANVGKLTVEITSGLLTASSSDATLTSLTSGDTTKSGTVTVAGGEYTFAKDVFLASDDACGTKVGTSLLKTENNVKSLVAGSIDDVDGTTGEGAAGGAYLCIEVDGDTVIPETGPYTMTTAYTSVTNAAFPLPSSANTMGSIVRDGTTVYIPYLRLTTAEEKMSGTGFAHRIIMVNRGEESVEYELTFHAEGEVEVVVGDDAEGMLMPGTTVLNLRNDDVASLPEDAAEGTAPRTAATLSVSAPTGTIDVSTVLVNRQDGSTDTVVYEEAM